MALITRFWLQVSAFIAFVLFVTAACFPFIRRVQITVLPSKAGSFHSSKQNVWADLSEDDARDLTKYLFAKTDLNLTEASKATSHDNSIVLLELLQPNKTNVLSYLNGTSGPPDRWARVVIKQGVTEQSQYVIYTVGPFPLSDASELLPLSFCYNSGRNHVFDPMPDEDVLAKWAVQVAMNASDITKELLQAEVNPYDPDTLGANGRVIIQDRTMIVWLDFYGHSYNPDSTFLLPQGLFIQINATGRDPSDWKVLQWSYNNVLYESASHLREAMKSPNLQKNGLNRDGNWTALEDFSDGIPDRKNLPPVMIQPSGGRFKIDEKQKFISWMGFEFFLTTSSDTAVALHDIKFDGDSVIYELGLQETFVTYAAGDPRQGGQDFLDSGLLMGFTMVELVPGYDCPAYATFLSTEYHIEDKTIPRKNSICIFEYTSDYPLQRHSSADRVSISKNTYMVIRFVSTVGNYDYSFDYIFYLDGTIEVKVRASGYIFGIHWDGNTSHRNEYGYRVHDAAATAMHDHVINFKADFDVAGISNRMIGVGIEPTTKEYPWDAKDYTPRNTMHLVHRTVEKETGINWAPNSGEILLVLNDNATNVWGEKRGYRIQPGSGIGTPIHRTAVNLTSSGVAAEWTKKDLWVLKRKDTEPKSSTVFNVFTPADPLVDFSRFVDEENVVDDDLVVFFNLGNHHVPHSGDIPNTLMHTSASSVMFTPFNFHDSDPTRLSAQGVRIDSSGEEAKAQYYGGRYRKGVTLKGTDLEPDQSQYNGPHVENTQRQWRRGVAEFVAMAFDFI